MNMISKIARPPVDEAHPEAAVLPAPRNRWKGAAIGIPHPKWDERPLLCVVRANGNDVSADEIREHLRKHVASWWLPDAIEFVDDLPHTATGKLSKLQLRERFKNYRFATAEEMVGRS